MALDDILSAFNEVGFKPRTLELDIPHNLADRLSDAAVAFLEIAMDKTAYTVLGLTSDKWKDNPIAIDFFFGCSKEERIEILAFLTLYVHEYTHRIDFLISPFGLQFYANTLREYWVLQEFFPRILDDPVAFNRVRFLVQFAENATEEDLTRMSLKEIWNDLEGIMHNFYAWGDASDTKPLGKYIEEGWGAAIKGAGDPFGVGIPMEPISVLKFFHTFRVPGGDKFWYLRPLTIFETKAVVNSLLFILHLLGEQGVEACLDYYETVYLARRTKLPQDYFFLLDLGARMYNANDFHTLLKSGHHVMIRSTLLILSTVCWYALQAPPFLKGEDFRIANPILRLWVSFLFFCGCARGQVKANFNSSAEGLLQLDGLKLAKEFYAKPIKDVLPDCRKVIDHMIERNQERTWNPDVKKHFNHIFTLMRPHFINRDLNYVSRMGMPEHGNPLFGCRTKEDWELTYDDYLVPEGVTEWFNIRTDLFFKLNYPSADIMKRLDGHYQAFFIPYFCECGATTIHWASRFAEEFTLTCGLCGHKKTFHRDEMIFHHARRKD